jgi:hypothetical protein
MLKLALNVSGEWPSGNTYSARHLDPSALRVSTFEIDGMLYRLSIMGRKVEVNNCVLYRQYPLEN